MSQRMRLTVNCAMDLGRYLVCPPFALFRATTVNSADCALCLLHIITPQRLPWDQQICGIKVGVFSETVKQVQLAWTSKNDEGALSNLDKQTLNEWYILNTSSQVASMML